MTTPCRHCDDTGTRLIPARHFDPRFPSDVEEAPCECCDRAEAHLALAIEHDVDADLADTDTEEDWADTYAADPEAPEGCRLTEDEIDALCCAEETRLSRSARIMAAIERAAGGL